LAKQYPYLALSNPYLRILLVQLNDINYSPKVF
jgi:hypothetical protein